MSKVWLEILIDDELKKHRPALLAKLAETIELWEPYHTLDKIIDEIDAANMQVWAGGFNGSCDTSIWGLTSFVTYSAGKAVKILWCAGDDGPHFFLPWVEAVERMAAMVGADFVEINGRLGWAKVFQPAGYKLKYVTLLKEVDHAGRRIGQSRADK